eukprot:TRINITY_DN3532_c0_g1_i1.p1 TRINITY_DN3532_c0_g1~~TRINITY_DN3532_c0_g1_i1.p1  ORF type:complete len:318 (+),score=54.51 TRINITY_DN3532_c0_g1_i1:138-1091(+)
MALDLLKSAKAALKSDELTIDTWVFKLHYRASVAILIGSSLVGVAKQYFGDPINCQTASGVNSKVLDDYCWIHSTFHIRTEFQGNVGCLVDPELMSDKQSFTGGTYYFDNSAPSVGLAQSSQPLAMATPDTAFYQWVPFVLVLQAALFYIPRKIWKTCEGGLIESFGKDANTIVILKGDSENQAKKGSVLKEDVARKYSSYFQSIPYHNDGYFAQIYLLLWFWMFGLTILTAIHLLLRFAVIIIYPLRYILILIKTRGFTQADLATCKSVLDRCHLGDWFVLYQLSKNSNTYFFRYLLKHLERVFTLSQSLVHPASE